ncbi:hypothetical protein DL768_008902 [Neofusicoccum parvum]|uniref:Uncharacterized protein n=1 Tax=Neofusicoccum parvum TaxID=310453 RepID=A0ACB5S6N7_9PEZI|nr:hypothetical protein DL768_008902 [Neofusicoccum parvum]
MYPKAHNDIFRPLDDGQIRLLLLQPGPVSEPLRGRLETVTLLRPPHYEALSYTWGDPERAEKLLVEDREVGITKNLHVALLHLRHATDVKALWVDALCICQEDHVEKSTQVRMMGDIFRNANRTWIWLGEASHEDEVVMEYLCTSARESAAADLPIHALQCFFGRAWFRRLWILQEALLSKQPIAVYGNKQTDFDRVVRLSTELIFDNLGNNRGDPFVHCYLERCLHEWDRLKEVLSERGGWPLVYAMPMTEQLQCTYFEDRVFALLGLATDADRESIRVDYTSSLERIQTELSAHLINSTDNPLAALHYMGVSDSSDQPSWSRDWREEKKVKWHFWRKAGDAQERWQILPKTQVRASGHPWLDAEAEKRAWRLTAADRGAGDAAHFSSDLKMLALQGVSVDTVGSVQLPPVDGDADSWKATCEAWRQTALDEASAYPGSQERLEAFCETLCRGSYRDDKGSLMTNCGEAYEAWIRGEDTSSSEGRPGNDFGFRMGQLRSGRSFVITSKGFVGLAPEKALAGDLVCFFMGNRDPFILRPKGTTSTEYRFIGETLITGMMEGELLAKADESEVTEFWIE